MIENEKVNMIIIPLDMNNQKITNVEVGDDDIGLVNFQQLNSYVKLLKYYYKMKSIHSNTTTERHIIKKVL